MIPLTAEPAMRTTFNWSGGQTGETHYTVSVAENGYNVITPSEIANPRSLQGRTGYVPYRWGDDPRITADEPLQKRTESAFYKYTIENPTRSQAENGLLDLTINDVSKITKSALASEWRGFIGTQLQIDGYYRYAVGDSKRRMLTAADFEGDNADRATEWYNRGGKISEIQIFRADQRVNHNNAEFEDGSTVTPTDTPMATITLDQTTLESLLGAVTAKGSYGTLKIELDEKSLTPYMNIDPKTGQKFTYGAVGTVRLAYDSMAANMMISNFAGAAYSGANADKTDNRSVVGVYDTDRNDSKDGTINVSAVNPADSITYTAWRTPRPTPSTTRCLPPPTTSRRRPTTATSTAPRPARCT